MRILHFSDTHVRRETGPDTHGVDARESLRLMLRDCADIPGIDVLVVTGDVADDGSREAYADVRDLVGAFARERVISAIMSTGNHDERHAFTQVLGSGHRDHNGADRPVAQLESAAGERAAASVIDGFRIVTLDSLVPGKAYGLVSDVQLDWLRDVLAEPAANGTILALHHPPIALPGVEVQHAWGLRNPDDQAGAIPGTDVRLILCGHFHLQLSGTLDGTPVWATPGVVNRVDLTAPPGTLRTVRGPAATLIDLSGPSPLFHTLHARDPLAGAVLQQVGANELAELIAKLGPDSR
jgi:3',5'-cyclic AMP phosphodiesterase CpdA